MWTPWRGTSGFPKALIISVVVLLVSSGLCGLQLALSSAANSSTLVSILMIPGVIELIAIWGSAAAIVVCLVGWLITAVYHAISKRKPAQDNSDTE